MWKTELELSISVDWIKGLIQNSKVIKYDGHMKDATEYHSQNIEFEMIKWYGDMFFAKILIWIEINKLGKLNTVVLWPTSLIGF